MDIDTLRKWIAERDSISILETVDVHTGVRSVLQEFDYVIEAPNWTQDGRYLVYNSRGQMYTYELATGEIREIDTGFAIDCNNDHVLSPDNTQLAVSHFTNEDATSRIYIVPFEGGEPLLVTEKGPAICTAGHRMASAWPIVRSVAVSTIFTPSPSTAARKPNSPICPASTMDPNILLMAGLSGSTPPGPD